MSLRPWEGLGNCVLGGGGQGGHSSWSSWADPPGSALTSLGFFLSGGSVPGEGFSVFSLEGLGQELRLGGCTAHSLCKRHLNCLFSNVLVLETLSP